MSAATVVLSSPAKLEMEKVAGWIAREGIPEVAVRYVRGRWGIAVPRGWVAKAKAAIGRVLKNPRRGRLPQQLLQMLHVAGVRKGSREYKRIVEKYHRVQAEMKRRYGNNPVRSPWAVCRATQKRTGSKWSPEKMESCVMQVKGRVNRNPVPTGKVLDSRIKGAMRKATRGELTAWIKSHPRSRLVPFAKKMLRQVAWGARLEKYYGPLNNRARRNNGELPPYQPFRVEAGPGAGFTISGDKQTRMFQLKMLLRALKMEVHTGMQMSRIGSASSIIKARFPFIKGRAKKKILEQWEPFVDKVLAGREPLPGYPEKAGAWRGASANRRPQRRTPARRNPRWYYAVVGRRGMWGLYASQPRAATVLARQRHRGHKGLRIEMARKKGRNFVFKSGGGFTVVRA